MGVSFLSLLLALTENLGEFLLFPIPFNPLAAPFPASSDRYILLLEATPDSISVECYFSFYFPNQEGEHPYLLALPLSIEAPSIDLETGEEVKKRLAPWEALLRRQSSLAPLRINLVNAWRQQASYLAPLARAHPWALPSSPFLRSSIELRFPAFGYGDYGRPLEVRWEREAAPEWVKDQPWLFSLIEPAQWLRLVVRIQRQWGPIYQRSPFFLALRFRLPFSEGQPLRLRFPLRYPSPLDSWFFWRGPERWEVQTVFLSAKSESVLFSRSLSPSPYHAEEIMGRWETPWARVLIHQARTQKNQLLVVHHGIPLEFVLSPPSSPQGWERERRMSRYDRSFEAWWDRHGLAVMRWVLAGEGLLLNLLMMWLLFALWRRGRMGQLDWPWLALPALAVINALETKMALSLAPIFPTPFWFLAKGEARAQDFGLFLSITGPGLALFLSLWRQWFQRGKLSPEEGLFWLSWPLLGLTVAQCGRGLTLMSLRAETSFLLLTPFLSGLALYILWRSLLGRRKTSVWSCLTLSTILTVGYFWLSPLAVRLLLPWAR